MRRWALRILVGAVVIAAAGAAAYVAFVVWLMRKL